MFLWVSFLTSEFLTSEICCICAQKKTIKEEKNKRKNYGCAWKLLHDPHLPVLRFKSLWRSWFKSHEINFMHSFFLPLPSPHPLLSQSLFSVLKSPLPPYHLSWCPFSSLHQMSWCPHCYLYHLRQCLCCSLYQQPWCTNCSFICPVVPPCTLHHVPESCLFCHQSWCCNSSIICPGVLSILSSVLVSYWSISSNALSVLSSSWCPLWPITCPGIPSLFFVPFVLKLMFSLLPSWHSKSHHYRLSCFVCSNYHLSCHWCLPWYLYHPLTGVWCTWMAS